MIDCLIECLKEPCCRSINYKKHRGENETNCEMLHKLVDNPASQEVLEKNNSYDHIYLINPKKVWQTVINRVCMDVSRSTLILGLYSLYDGIETIIPVRNNHRNVQSRF